MKPGIRNEKSTMVELVDELRKLPQTIDIKHMIAEALDGQYHDYKNTKYDCGKMESSRRLRVLGHAELAKRIEDGEFDEEADEQDKKRMIEEIYANTRNSHEAEGLINILGLRK